MWTLDNIKAANICAFKELDYSPLQGHTTLVFGNNLDNDSQGSNGSGKSALIETIAIGITGDSLRKVKADEIINDAADEANIVLTFSNTGSDDTFVVERTLSRTNPQQIVTTLNGTPVVQPSVLEYNKYVLDVLGLTKDDVFANYILSKHKYSSFLSASDKDKKELINRFSNGSMVDESIVALRSDIADVKSQLNKAEVIVAGFQGKVEATEDQIATTKAEYQAKENRKSEIIAAHNESIVRYREKIRLANEKISSLEDVLDLQDNADAELRKIEEDSSSPVSDAYDKVSVLLQQAHVEPVRDYRTGSKTLAAEFEKQRKQVESDQTRLKAHEADVNRLTRIYSELKEELEETESAHTPVTKKLREAMDEGYKHVQALDEANKEIRAQISALDRNLAGVNKLLAGVIECPKCRHKFVIQSEKSVHELQKEAESIERKIYRLKKSESDNQAKSQEQENRIKDSKQRIHEMEDQCDQLSKKVRSTLMGLNALKDEASTLSSSLNSGNSRLKALEQRILNLRQTLFDEAFDHLDMATKKIEGEVESAKVDISTWIGNIESYLEAIKEVKAASIDDAIRSLEEKKGQYNNELSKAISEKEAIERQLATLTAQEARFIDFKTHLANSKIEALAQITNEFLEAIGSDLRISFSGYTVLKSGKIRDKISISVLRDGIDCGSFAKMSQGEQCRANLASILALHKLTNVNCQGGKGLDLLILDEILDATDEAGLASMFDALNSLKVTAMVVSHGLVQENYPYRLVVTKQNGISTLNENNQQ